MTTAFDELYSLSALHGPSGCNPTYIFMLHTKNVLVSPIACILISYFVGLLEIYSLKGALPLKATSISSIVTNSDRVQFFLQFSTNISNICLIGASLSTFFLSSSVALSQIVDSKTRNGSDLVTWSS